MDKVFLNLFGEKSQYNTFLQRINGVLKISNILDIDGEVEID